MKYLCSPILIPSNPCANEYGRTINKSPLGKQSSIFSLICTVLNVFALKI